MVLLAVMKPRVGFDGVVALHSFVQRVAAKRASRRRDTGVIELKSYNVNGESYLEAWKTTILPALKRLIDEGSITTPTEELPFLLQDDNAKPHRKVIGGVSVLRLICQAAHELGVHMQPLVPPQPAQSPDLNPLDTFVFRMLNLRFRRLRAQERVKWSARGLRSREIPDAMEVEALDVIADEDLCSDEDGGEDGVLQRLNRVPLRCGAQRISRAGNLRPFVCPGCKGLVRENAEATQCDLRQGWWHDACVQALLSDAKYARAVNPGIVEEDGEWICPQCSHHLCRNDDLTKALCVACGLPSVRSGDDMGRDMTACDSRAGGLFHKTCVSYDEDAELEEGCDNWFCVACDSLLEDPEFEELEILEQDINIAASSVESLEKAICLALQELPREAFKRGFETRQHIMRMVVAAEGKNTYDVHWREPDDE